MYSSFLARLCTICNVSLWWDTTSCWILPHATRQESGTKITWTNRMGNWKFWPIQKMILFTLWIIKALIKIFLILSIPTRHRKIIKRSQDFQGITHYINSAIDEFSDDIFKIKRDTRRLLIEFYKTANMQLGHIIGNLNQACIMSMPCLKIVSILRPLLAMK